MIKRICYFFLLIALLLSCCGCVTTTVVGGSIGWLFPDSSSDGESNYEEYTTDLTKNELDNLYVIADECWTEYEDKVKESNTCNGSVWTFNSSEYTDNRTKLLTIIALENNINITSITKELIADAISTYISYHTISTSTNRYLSDGTMELKVDFSYYFFFDEEKIDEKLLGQIELSELYIYAIENKEDK